MEDDFLPREMTASSSPIEAGVASRVSTEDLATLLKALADDTRLRIFALLTKAELCVCEIEDILGLPQSLVSNHLAVLRRVGLVESRRDAEDARWVFYRAEPAAAAVFRERLRALLDVRTVPGDRRRAEQVCRIRRR
jgi:DNA-binding transcriptional ArsR family regulator